MSRFKAVHDLYAAAGHYLNEAQTWGALRDIETAVGGAMSESVGNLLGQLVKTPEFREVLREEIRKVLLRGLERKKPEEPKPQPVFIGRHDDYWEDD